MKRIVVLLSLLAIVSLILTACGGTPKAANHLEAIKQAGVIKIGTSADYEPYESKNAAGEFVGFDIELMDEIAKRMGVEIEWVDMPFDSLIAAVQEGKIDASISCFNYSEERDQTIDFSAAYYTSEDAFIVADSFAGTIGEPQDVGLYRVGVQTGTTQADWLNTLIEEGGLKAENLYTYERVDQALLDLKSGRVDVVMADYVPAKAAAEKQGGLKIVYQGVLSSGPLNIVIPDGDAELQQAIDAVITELQAEGFIDQLAEKYFAD